MKELPANRESHHQQKKKNLIEVMPFTSETNNRTGADEEQHDGRVAPETTRRHAILQPRDGIAKGSRVRVLV
jgi:hypothetical protein